MIKRYLFGLLLLLALPAHAVQWVKQPKEWVWNLMPYGTPDMGCSAWYNSTYSPAAQEAAGGFTVTLAADGESAACRTNSGGGFSLVRARYQQCPADTVAVDEVGHYCGMPDPPPCKDPNPYQKSYREPRPSRFPTQDGICIIRVVEVVGCRTLTTGPDAYKVNICTYMVVKTGEQTNLAPPMDQPETPMPSPTQSKPAPIQPTQAQGSEGCPSGTVAAGLDKDGITICMGMGTEPPAPKPAPTTTTKPPVTTTNPDGSTTTVTEKIVVNSDGSTTTTKDTVTTAADGTTTRAQSVDVSANSNGGAGRSDEGDDEKDSLCKSNPELTVCRNSSVAGSCGQISCQGDAIQCATLREVAIQQCRDKEREDQIKESALYTKGQGVIDGIPEAGVPSKDNAENYNVQSTLSQDSFLAGGSCFKDRSISMLGHTVKLPLSAGCDALIALRYALMVVASLVSYRILSGTFLKA